MNKKLLIILVIVLVVILGGAAYAIRSRTSSPTDDSNASSASQNSAPVPSSTDNAKDITVSGVIGCLMPKDTNSAVNSSCAIGIKSDDGKSYALSAKDPTLTGSVPTGTRVQVTGSLTVQSSKFDAIGTIQVRSLERK